MVQTNFSVGNAGSLTTVLTDISSGADAAINTAYTITMTAGVSLAASVSLGTGSSLTLEGSYPFIVSTLDVTGTLITDLNLTGTVALDNGVLENPALTTVNGTIVAGLYTGTILGTVGDASDTTINNGTISSAGTFTAIEFYNGTIQNGWSGLSPALISGGTTGVQFDSGGLLQNGGSVVANGLTSIGVSIGTLGGTVDNGQIGETGALISGSESGVQILGAGAVNNDGTILGGASDAVYLSAGLITNGQVGIGSAMIEDAPGAYGVWIGSGSGIIDNNGTILGGSVSGIYLESGGTVTNGAPADTTALLNGASDGVLLGGLGVLLNYGTVLATGSGSPPYVIGAFFQAGGTVENLATSAVIVGSGWGVVVENGTGIVSNLGTIQATGASGLGIDFTAGGTVVNGLAATISGGFDGVRIAAGAVGAGAMVQNAGTIQGYIGVDFLTDPPAAAGTLINDGLIEGTSGNAVTFGTGTETLVLQSAGAFVGNVVGGTASGSSTTLELASGTQGTLSGLASNGGTVTDSAGSFVFSNFSTIALDAGASWTVAAPGAVNTLSNAGALDVSGGSVTVTGSLTNSGGLLVAGATLTATTGQIVDSGIITVGTGGLLKAVGGGITTGGTADILVGGGTSATLNVTGTGATVNTGGDQIGIGSSGEGSALISQGGTILAGTPFASDEAIYTGGIAGSTGGLTVTDPGSLLRATGQFSVGLGGNGSLLIENKATVITGNNLVDTSEGIDIGQLASASGDVTVTGTQSVLSNTGQFIVGDAGLGSLSIQSAGTVTTSAGATIADQASASGSSVNVTGTGSTWQITGALDIGNAGAGALSINAGGSVSATTLDAGVQNTGAIEGSAQIALSGTGSSLTLTGDAIIADAGSAALSILNGATVNAQDLIIGAQSTASGAVLVSDTGSLLNLTGTLYVGTPDGIGELTIGPNAAIVAARVILEGEVVNEGGLLDPNEIDVTPGNPIVGFGTVGALAGGDIIVNTGSIEAKAGTHASQKVETVIGTILGSYGAFAGTGYLVIDAGSTLDLTGGPVDASQSVVFGAATGALVVGDIGGFGATVGSFVAGDTIIVNTPGAATFSQSGSVVSVIESGTTLGVITFASAALAGTAFTAPGALVDHALCFLAGTLIGTPAGERPVQDLAAGDLVLTASGVARPVVWVGQGRVLATRGRRGPATPVIVRKGALGANVPHTDLRVTKGHALLVDGVLIPVEFLVNHRSVLWDDRAQEVVVYHVELATHDVLVANGAAAESYRDDGNRWLFANANAGWGAAAKPPCAEVLTGGAVVDAVWRRLLDRAGPRPSVPLTAEADVHLLVDGVRVDPAHRTGDVLVFGLSRRPGDVRVVSRAAVPQELGLARDPRLLGVALRRVVARQGTRFRTLRADDARLVDGFHAFEPDAGVRWTDGDATLPDAVFAGFDRACELVIHLGGTATYIDDGAIASVA